MLSPCGMLFTSLPICGRRGRRCDRGPARPSHACSYSSTSVPAVVHSATPPVRLEADVRRRHELRVRAKRKPSRPAIGLSRFGLDRLPIHRREPRVCSGRVVAPGYRIDWQSLHAVEPRLDEVATHARELAIAYNDPRNAPLLGHEESISETEVVDHYEAMLDDGARPFLLYVDGAFCGDADLRRISDGAAEFAFMVAAPSSQGRRPRHEVRDDDPRVRVPGRSASSTSTRRSCRRTPRRAACSRSSATCSTTAPAARGFADQDGRHRDVDRPGHVRGAAPGRPRRDPDRDALGCAHGSRVADRRRVRRGAPVYFLVLEMFLWTTPYGAKTFKRPLEEMQAQKVLAGNQGLYNGFLAAGLVWSLSPRRRSAFRCACSSSAACCRGALWSCDGRASQILFVQALPAGIALAFTLLR